jgi:predicted MPP superfamily phosphohydrolase
MPLSRRSFLRTLIRATALLGASAASGAGYSMFAEPGWLSVERVDVPIRNLPHGLAGLRIAQLSDLHASPQIAPAQLAQAASAVLREQPDLVVLTGDYVTHGLEHLPDAIAAIAMLAAPLGVFAVLGNHDHWTGAAGAVERALEQSGARVLSNRAVQLMVGGEALWLAGVDDVWEERADLEAALEAVPPGATTVLLAHEPDFADTAARHAIALQLSGHSHGGQVRLPFLGAPVLPFLGQRYPIGLQRVPGSDTLVYTNRGIGMVSPAVRFNCRPEVAILRLVAA